jgi:ethanolamine utilization protein EutP
MRTILLIGGIGAGKTSLKQRLMNETLTYRKTQMLEFSGLFIDCPGEYLEIPRYYHVLIDISHRVSEVWALQAADRAYHLYPPKFAAVFNKPVVGVVTKIDLPGADTGRAVSMLGYAGIREPIYLTSAVTGDGYDALRIRLEASHE